MKKSFLLLLFFASGCFRLSAQAPEWQVWADDVTAECFLEDGDFIWIATWGGLVKYDKTTGQHEIFRTDRYLMGSNWLKKIVKDVNGLYWIESYYGMIYTFDGEQFSLFESFPDGSQINYDSLGYHGNNLSGSVGGHIGMSLHWNSCDTCVTYARYDGQNWFLASKLEVMAATQGGYVSDPDNDGRMWGESIDHQNLFYYQNGNVISFDTSNSPINPNASSYRVIPCRTGGIFFTDIMDNQSFLDTIYYYDGASWITYDLPYDSIWVFEDPEFDAQGQLHVKLRNSAIVTFDGQNWSDFDLQDMGMPNCAINSYLFDSNGDFWLGVWAQYAMGVYRYDGQSFHYNSYGNIGANTNYTEAVFGDTSGNIWTGLNECVRVVKADGQNTEYNINDFGGSPRVSDFKKAPNGDVYAFGNGGVYRFDGFAWHSLPQIAYVRKGAIDSAGNIWAASTGDGLFKFDGIAWQNIPLPNNSTYVWDVAIDHSGGIWIGSHYEIYYYNETLGTFQQYPFNQNNNFFYSFNIDRYDRVWATFSSTQLALLTAGTFQDFPTPFDEGSAQAWDVVIDYDGNYWFAHGKSLVFYDGTNWALYDYHNSSLPNASIFEMDIDAYGNLVLATIEGLIIFNRHGISHTRIDEQNHLKCRVFYDENANKIEDPSEFGIQGIEINLLPIGITTYSNNQGNSILELPSGQYTASLNLPNGWYLTTDSVQYHVFLQGGDTTEIMFGIKPEFPFDSASMSLVLSEFRCNVTTNAWTTLRNEGTTILDGRIIMNLDSGATFFSSNPPPLSYNTDSVVWEIPSLTINQTVGINAQIQMPDFNAMGQTLDFHARFERPMIPNGSPEILCGDHWSDTLNCAYDPNDKAVRSEGPSLGHYTLLNSPLTYTVRFQNTGNAPAFQVVVVDTLDMGLDTATFELLAASHPVEVIVRNRIVFFVFENINLPDSGTNEPASHGFVQFRIKPLAGLPNNTNVRNDAYIYFDYNPPIATNNTHIQYVDQLPVGISQPIQNATSMLVFPNPASGMVYVQLPEPSNELSHLLVYNSMGQLVKNVEVMGSNGAFSVGDLPVGLYYIRVENNENQFVKLLIFK